MRVKKYTGATLAEAVERVKLDMGPEALILQTRWVRAPGWKGWFRRRAGVEVTAAVAGDELPAAGPAVGPERSFTPRAAVERLDPGRLETAAAAPAGGGAVVTAVADIPLAADVQQVKELVGAIWRQVQATRDEPETAAPPMYPQVLEPVYQALLRNDVAPSLARCVTDALLENCEGKGEGLIRQEAYGIVERLLGPARPIELNGRCRVVALVGPTGVGKTTTLAKLAAHHALVAGKRVAMVTLDTVRVGAIEQLRTYAEITGLPSYVATSPAEMAEILERLQDFDLVLLDTAGRNPRDEMRMSELERFWAARRPDEVHLVLSATTRYADALEIVERYRGPGFDRLLFTKLDETSHHGLLLNLAVAAQRPLSYVTTGQNVPEDIAAARAGDLAKLIL